MNSVKHILLFFGLLFCAAINAQDKGRASYYSNKLHNKRTTGGYIYQKDSMICAHKTYPFGSFLESEKCEKQKRGNCQSDR